jgi:hypothetical protein
MAGLPGAGIICVGQGWSITPKLEDLMISIFLE